LVPGDYRVEILPILTVPPSALTSNFTNAYVKSIRLGGTDVLNGGLHLDSAPNGTMQVVISMNGGAITGRVLDAAGKPVPNTKVVLVPNAPRRERGDLYKFDSTDDSGAYELRGIAPGEYKIFAWERVEEGAWQDPQFIKLYEDRGTPLRVEENRRVNSDIKMILAWN